MGRFRLHKSILIKKKATRFQIAYIFYRIDKISEGDLKM